MLNKDRVKERFETLKIESRKRLEELRSESKERLEELKVEGSQLADKVRDIINEGKARKVTIRKGDRILAEFPLVVGIGGAAAAVIMSSTLAAVAAIGALVSDVTVVVHRDTPQHSDEDAQMVEFTEVDE